MKVEFLTDTGSRYEWSCLYCSDTYIVSYHYVDNLWSAQYMRRDGEREVTGVEGVQILRDFPYEEALAMVPPKQEPLRKERDQRFISAKPVNG